MTPMRPGLRPVPKFGGQAPGIPASNGSAGGSSDPDEPDADDQQDGGVKPEWVDYGTEAENCKNCEYMQADGSCSVLNIQVGPEDHCKAFSPKSNGGQPSGGQPPQTEPSPGGQAAQ